MGGNIVSKYEYGDARRISGWTCSNCNYKTDYIHKLEEHEERSHAVDTMQEDDYVGTSSRVSNLEQVLARALALAI